MSIILLIVGFALLIKGADMFVGGASEIAKKLGVPSMIIGLTVVAMGTSAPEAAVSVSSSLAGQNEMSIANVVGSNLFNMLMVLGVSAIIAKLPVSKETNKEDGPFLRTATIALLLLCIDMKLDRLDGVILLGAFIGFLIKTIKSATGKKDVVDEVAIAEEVVAKEKETNMVKVIIMSIIGVVGIVVGGDMVVDSATKIATAFGMSSNLVGLTIVAMGTSLPEFVTSIMAIKKGETDIAIGNVIGSNIFNILLVLGLAATISPMVVSAVALMDMVFMTAVTILLMIYMKKGELNKKNGIILLCTYLGYMIYTVLR